MLNEGLPDVMVTTLPDKSVEVLANTVEVTPDESVVVSVNSVKDSLSMLVLHSRMVEIEPLLLVVVP